MENTSRSIYIDRFDLERLKLLLQTQGDLTKPDKASLRDLVAALERAVVTSDEEDIPRVVTLNRRFRFRDLDTGEQEDLTLVFPGKSAKGLGKLSVLTPVGAAVLGARERQTISVRTPEGSRRLRIESIFVGSRAEERSNLSAPIPAA